MWEVLVVVAAVVVIAAFMILKFLGWRAVVLYEYQRGLKYTNGRYVQTLPAGRYHIFSRYAAIIPVDVRPEFVTIPGQDLLTADGVSIKISIAAEFQVSDPNVAVNRNSNYRNSLYLTLQMAAREIVGKEKVDALVENRAAFSKTLMEMTISKTSEFGLKLNSADVKDIMFPGEMKRAFAQVIKAQKEGQAALEKARGETAALRSLANAARMLDDNPNLLQLRALQAVAESSGNTLVFGLSNGTIPVTKTDPTQRKPRPETPDES